MAQRVTNEQVIAAYRETGSVWKAAKVLGIVGQSVWERLKGLGIELPKRTWKAEELAELRALAATCTIGEIGQRLGRPYYGVAIKLSRLGLASRVGNRRRFEKPTRLGASKAAALRYAALLPGFAGSLRSFARTQGVSTTSLVTGLQQHAPGAWAAIVAERGIEQRQCVTCGDAFPALSKKQTACSTACRRAKSADAKYFGGNRKNTIGLAEQTCQVCGRHVEKGLSSHHVIGKEHDPENEILIALCRGCHQLVGRLGACAEITDRPEAWESLISLALMRLHGAKRPIGTHVCVDWDWLTEEDLEDEAES